MIMPMSTTWAKHWLAPHIQDFRHGEFGIIWSPAWEDVFQCHGTGAENTPGISLTQKTALLPVQPWAPPDIAPGVLGDELLSRPREWACVVPGVVDVLMAKDGSAHLQPLVKELIKSIGL